MNKIINRLIIFLLCNFWTIFVIVGPVLFFVIDDDTWIHNVNERRVPDRVKGYSFQEDDAWKIVQISDTHISHQYPERAEQFEHIIERINLIKPKAVFHTGDIVDGTTYSFPYLRAKQHIRDWETYRRLVTDSGMNKTDFWFDVPGNHDYYETKTSDKHKPLPRRYTVRKYAGFQEEVILEHSGKKYRFIFLDINTKPSNPHTFEGLLRGNNLEKFKKTLQNNTEYDNTFVVNHYPLYNVISSSPNRLSRKHKKLLSETLTASISGHIHIGGYLRTKSHVELICSALKSFKGYRIITMDNGLFNVKEMKTTDNLPIVAITMPKDAHLLTEFERISFQSQSHKVRAFITSEHPISSVICMIDGEKVCDMTNLQQDLYSCDLPASLKLKGLHHIKVQAEDVKGNKGDHSYDFSFDGTVPKKGYTSANSIMNVIFVLYVFSVIFTIMWLIVLPIIYTKLMNKCAGAQPQNKFLQALDKIFGSVAIAWVDATYTGNATISDYMQSVKSNIVTRFFSFFFWQAVRTLSQFGQLTKRQLVFFLVMGILPIAIPLFFTVETGVLFSFGVVHKEYVPYYGGNLMAIAYYIGFYAICLCVVCDINQEHRCPTNKNLRARIPSPYGITMFIISMLFALIYIILAFSVFPAYAFFASPLTWMIALLWVFVFIEGLNARNDWKPKETSESNEADELEMQ